MINRFKQWRRKDGKGTAQDQGHGDSTEADVESSVPEVKQEGDILDLLQQHAESHADGEDTSAGNYTPVINRNENKNEGDGVIENSNRNSDDVYKTSYLENNNSNYSKTAAGSSVDNQNHNQNTLGQEASAVNNNSNHSETVAGSRVVNQNPNTNILGRTGRAVNNNKNRTIIRE